MAGRARDGRDRRGHVLVRLARDRARRIKDGRDRDGSFSFPGRRSRGKGRGVHANATHAAMAAESSRSAGRRAFRRVVHAPARLTADWHGKTIVRSAWWTV